MLLRREGLPDEDELVLCTITGVQPHSVFARLDEYEKTGLIHISEIAPGRIRNIREHVQEGKKVVCKVLRVDKERGYIDLSLRRVNDGQRRAKLNEIKQEQLAERIVEHVAHKHKMKGEQLYNKLTDIIFKNYPGLFVCFKDVADNKVTLEKLGVEKGVAADLEEQIKIRLVAEEVVIKGQFRLRTHAPDGVVQIRDALNSALKVDKKVVIRYLGNGVYHVDVKADDFKSAEKVLKKVTDSVFEYAKEHKMIATFDRQE